MVPPGSGANNVFSVSVGFGSSAQSVTGNDTYSYPVPPSVTRVSGCSDQGSVTTNCPPIALNAVYACSFVVCLLWWLALLTLLFSGAQIRLTVYGSAFGSSGAAVTVGGHVCQHVTQVAGQENTLLTCDLPQVLSSSLLLVVQAYCLLIACWCRPLVSCFPWWLLKVHSLALACPLCPMRLQLSTRSKEREPVSTRCGCVMHWFCSCVCRATTPSTAHALAVSF